MHFWDGFYNRNVSFVIIMDMSGLRITTKASDLPWGRVPVFLIVFGCGGHHIAGMVPPRCVIRILNQIIQFVPH